MSFSQNPASKKPSITTWGKGSAVRNPAPASRSRVTRLQDVFGNEWRSSIGRIGIRNGTPTSMPGGTELPSAGAPTVADSVFSENESNEDPGPRSVARGARAMRAFGPTEGRGPVADRCAAAAALRGARRHAYGDYQAKLFALKLGNYAVAKYHFVNRHAKVVSRPVTLMHDPSNACQLQCPACVHTDNAEYKKDMLWPAATMKVAAFDRALRGIGPFAFNVVYYNYGEPLLNKDLPELLRISNGYGLSSCFSTNLSLKFDVERFVAAAPEHVILSIDGVSQATYGRYRKRGNLALVLENVKALVAAKKKLGKNRPFLSCGACSAAFEHNVHEVEQAMELSAQMGVDRDRNRDAVRRVLSTTRGSGPFGPSTRVTTRSCPGHREIRMKRRHGSFDTTKWRGRSTRAGSSGRAPSTSREPSGHRASSTCLWLYFSVSLDAAQRLMRVLHGGRRESDRSSTETSPRVSPILSTSRPSRAQAVGVCRIRPRFEAETAGESSADLPYCSRCNEAPTLTYEPRAVVADIEAMDHRGVLGRDAESLRALAIW